LSEAYCADGNYDPAAAAAKAASEIAYQEDDEKLEAEALDSLTTIYMEAGKFEKAGRTAEQARRLWHSFEEFAKECHAMSQTAMAFVNQAYKKQNSGKSSASSAIAGFFEKAIKASNECIALSAELSAEDNPDQYAATANCVLAQVHAAQGEFEQSLETAKQAIKLYQSVADQRGEGYAHLLVAQAQVEDKKWEAANKSANSSLKLLKKAKDEAGQEMVETLLAKIEKNMPKPEPVWAAQGMMGWGEPVKGGGKGKMMPSMQMQMPMEGMDMGGGGDMVRKRAGGDALDIGNLSEELVVGKIKEVAMAIIGDDEDIELDTPLMEAGVTSSTAVILKDELAGEIPGIKLPPTLIFDYPSITAIGEYIMEVVNK